MSTFRVASLNMNGRRDHQKRLLVSNIVSQKKLDVLFLQETHTDRTNEVDWGRWWTGYYNLSHGTNLSAGVAVLFSPRLDLRLVSYTEIVPGRLLAVRAEIQGIGFVFVNVYAPNQGSGRLELFQKLSSFVQQCEQDECVVLGGDWNCTTDFTLDRTGQEPDLQSAAALARLEAELAVVDVWRVKHPHARQYTWVKVVNGLISAARMDWFYMLHSFSNRLLSSHTYPVGFTDHHLFTFDFHVAQKPNAALPVM